MTINKELIDNLHTNNKKAIPSGDVDIVYATCLEAELKKLLGEPLNAYTLSLAVANASKRFCELTM